MTLRLTRPQCRDNITVWNVYRVLSETRAPTAKPTATVQPTPPPTVTPVPSSAPTVQWYKSGDPSKDCDWVGSFLLRCDAIGWDGTFAFESCTVCGGSVLPTSVPSPAPSSSLVPTLDPASIAITLAPTTTTTTETPTLAPTSMPTVTETPTVSPMPSIRPSPLPTSLPTSVPTSVPTPWPTPWPTVLPSADQLPAPTAHGTFVSTALRFDNGTLETTTMALDASHNITGALAEAMNAALPTLVVAPGRVVRVAWNVDEPQEEDAKNRRRLEEEEEAEVFASTIEFAVSEPLLESLVGNDLDALLDLVAESIVNVSIDGTMRNALNQTSEPQLAEAFLDGLTAATAAEDTRLVDVTDVPTSSPVFNEQTAFPTTAVPSTLAPSVSTPPSPIPSSFEPVPSTVPSSPTPSTASPSLAPSTVPPSLTPSTVPPTIVPSTAMPITSVPTRSPITSAPTLRRTPTPTLAPVVPAGGGGGKKSSSNDGANFVVLIVLVVVAAVVLSCLVCYVCTRKNEQDGSYDFLAGRRRPVDDESFSEETALGAQGYDDQRTWSVDGGKDIEMSDGSKWEEDPTSRGGRSYDDYDESDDDPNNPHESHNPVMRHAARDFADDDFSYGGGGDHDEDKEEPEDFDEDGDVEADLDQDDDYDVVQEARFVSQGDFI